MLFGYNTNGLAFHRPEDAIDLIADVGYRAVAITVDHVWLDPFSFSEPDFCRPGLDDRIARLRELLDRRELVSAIESGARYLLNPRIKHEPTLMSASPADRRVRIAFLKMCIDIARELGAAAVSFWSGVLRDDPGRDAAFDRLAGGCRELIDHAGQQGVRLAFEPEPGMFVEQMQQFATLLDRVDAPHFGLTLDIGHVQCVETPPAATSRGTHQVLADTSIAMLIRRWAGKIFNVHIEDMVAGVHEHLRFGEGEIDFLPVLAALHEIGYGGPVSVELSRHSHMAPQVARESLEFLQSSLTEALG